MATPPSSSDAARLIGGRSIAVAVAAKHRACAQQDRTPAGALGASTPA
jgi:hypothetical protein